MKDCDLGRGQPGADDVVPSVSDPTTNGQILRRIIGDYRTTGLWMGAHLSDITVGDTTARKDERRSRCMARIGGMPVDMRAFTLEQTDAQTILELLLSCLAVLEDIQKHACGHGCNAIIMYWASVSAWVMPERFPNSSSCAQQCRSLAPP